MPTNSRVVLVDRSRMSAYQVCPRYRYLTYHYEGRGLAPRVAVYEQSFGTLLHAGLEQLVLRRDDDTIIRELSEQLDGVLASHPAPPHAGFRDEQQYLLQGLLWAWARVRRPTLEREFDVVSLEREFLWTIGSADGVTIVDMVRLDALLTERVTDTLFYKEYKSTAWGDDRWSSAFDHNGQMLANLSAVEEALEKRPGGALIEGLLKGPVRRDTAKSSRTSGLLIQDSPLTYVYQKGLGDISLTWRYGAVRVPILETGFSPKQWALEYLDEVTCEKLFIQLPPISPDPGHVARWRRQTLLREVRIAEALETLRVASSGVQQDVLDRVFPLHEESCIRYGRKCGLYRVCHEATVAVEPLACEDFVPRVPHHPAEADALGLGEAS